MSQYPPAPPPFSPPPPPPGYGYGAPGMAVGMAVNGPGNLYRDPGSGLMIPQGTQLAGVGRRIGAFFLAIPLAIVTLFIGYAIWGLIVWGRGQTPALQVLGMRCYRPDDAKPANWGWMALREIVGRFIEGLLSIITQLISLVLFLSRADHRSLHDMVAGTVVLHDPNKILG